MLPGVPVAGALGDQQAALFGQTCFQPGEAKCTYGTGSFLLLNTGTSPVTSTHGLLTTVGYRLGDAARVRPGGRDRGDRLAGAVAAGQPRPHRHARRRSRRSPRTVDDNGGCYIVPAFSGLFAPHWRSDARGVIAGLTVYITKGHLARAVLEATGWQTREVVDAMNADSEVALRRLRVDGGMTANELLMQFLADVLDVPVVRPLGRRDGLPRRGVRGRAGGRLLAGPRGAARATGTPPRQWEPAMDPGRRARSTGTGGGRSTAATTGCPPPPPSRPPVAAPPPRESLQTGARVATNWRASRYKRARESLQTGALDRGDSRADS